MQDSTVHHPDIMPPAATGRRSRNNLSPEDEMLHQRMLDRLRTGKDVRVDLTDRVGSALNAGGYDNDLKLDIALDRMIDEACDETAPARPYGRRATDVGRYHQTPSGVC